MAEALPERPQTGAAVLEQLLAGLTAARDGDFAIRVPRSGDPLLDDIATAYNEMAEQHGAHDAAPPRFPATLSHELRTPLNSLLVLARLLAQNPDGNLTPQQVEYADVIHSAGADLLRVLSDLPGPRYGTRHAPDGQVDVAEGSAGLQVLVIEATSSGLLTLLAHGAVSDLASVHEPVAVQTAATADEVAEALASGPYQCVVIDLGSPDTLLRTFGSMLTGPAAREVPMPEVPVLAHARDDTERAQLTRLRPDTAGWPVEVLRSPDELRARIAACLSVAPRNGREPPVAAAAISFPAATRLVPAPRTPGHPSLRGKKILVIDDNAHNVFAITSTLEYYGMTVARSADGRSGIRLLRDQPDTDLVLMDLMMPGLDGFAAIAEIRNIPEFSDLAIIAVTARPMVGAGGLEVPGADDCVTKPLDTDDLLTRMERLLAV